MTSTVKQLIAKKYIFHLLLIHIELLYTQVTGFQIILYLAKLNLLKEKEKHNSLLNLMFNFVSLFNIHYSIK